MDTSIVFLEKCRAAYKGFADCIRLLLFLDAYRGRQDKEGNLQFCLLDIVKVLCFVLYIILECYIMIIYAYDFRLHSSALGRY